MMSEPSPLLAYTHRHAALSAELALERRRARSLRLLLTLLLAAGALLVLLALRSDVPWWPLACALAALLATFAVSHRNQRRQDRLSRLLDLYDRALRRLDRTAVQSGHTGEEFRLPNHLYDRDLGILGADSLFGLLATVRTGVGQRGLARDLLEPHTRESTLARQSAIQELTPSLPLREAIHLLGSSSSQQVPGAFFDVWLDEPSSAFHPIVRPLLVLTSSALIGGLIAGLFHVLAWTALRPNLLLALAAQCGLGFYLRPRIVPILNGAAHLSNQMRMFEDGLALIEHSTFHAPHLVALQQRTLAPRSAVATLKQVQAQFAIVEQRTKGFFLVASLLTNAGTHAALSIAAWRRRHAAAMKDWLAVWAEFESLNALATYAYEHPDHTFPELLPVGTALFEAAGLAHPLLGPEAVANDIALNTTQSLSLISGSNMAGKSTLLRAVGLNAVLAAAGAPVRATSARLSPLALGASLALTDSLAGGRSKFLAEVERLRDILNLAAGPLPVLFLIDEIFSGTNSVDRRIASEAVARALIDAGAVGALSTHDLTLTEMSADPGLRAINLHMASPDPTDPLAFDYRLKPGVNPGSNALAILRWIGIALP
jgi:hypothetical protein